jgi:hypothetical protein
MSIYRHKGSPNWHFDFQVRGVRFHGSTGTGDRRKAEAVERAEREKAKAARRTVSDVPHTFGEAVTRFWHEKGQHDATSDDTLRNLVWLGNAIGEHTPLVDIDGNVLHRIIARRRGEPSKNGGKLVTNATVNRTVTEPLRRLIKRAKEWGALFPREHRWKDYKLKEPAERVRELRIDEGCRIDAAMRDDYAPFFALARVTGMRLNECLLKWSEVDWDARQILKTGKGGVPVTVQITSAVREILWPLRGHRSMSLPMWPREAARGAVAVIAIRSHIMALRPRGGVSASVRASLTSASMTSGMTSPQNSTGRPAVSRSFSGP